MIENKVPKQEIIDRWNSVLLEYDIEFVSIEDSLRGSDVYSVMIKDNTDLFNFAFVDIGYDFLVDKGITPKAYVDLLKSHLGVK